MFAHVLVVVALQYLLPPFKIPFLCTFAVCCFRRQLKTFLQPKFRQSYQYKTHQFIRLRFGVFCALYTFTYLLNKLLDCCVYLQWTVLPLSDNYDEDEFQYLIHVHTGFKLSAGTKSKVFFRVNGTEGETGERRMDDGIRQVGLSEYFHNVLAYHVYMDEIFAIKSIFR